MTAIFFLPVTHLSSLGGPDMATEDCLPAQSTHSWPPEWTPQPAWPGELPPAHQEGETHGTPCEVHLVRSGECY